MAQAPAKRPYRMRARAASAAATRQRLLDAALELFGEKFLDEITLEEVAERAGVSVQTLLRHFGSRDRLFEDVTAQVRDRVEAQRGTAPVGDLAAAVRTLVDHYEDWGERVTLRLLAQEGRDPLISDMTATARALHRDWVERVFETTLARRSGAERRRLLAQLVAVCDVYFWKVLRKDMGLSRRETERAILEALERSVTG
jgi:AcrR family transcriptional regulator